MNRMLTAVMALAAGVLCSLYPAQAGSSRYNADYFSNRPVLTQDGRRLRFYDDLIKDKIVVVSFIFTSCTDLCPLTTARLAEVQRRLGDLVGREIFFISLTVDPENDTPERLKQFADAFDVGPGWTFVTGAPEDMKAINHALGDRSRTLSEHRNEVVLGNDRTGEWARDSTFGEIDRLVLEIRAMDPVWRNNPRVLDDDDTVTREAVLGEITQEPGQALFKKVCASCHSVGVGDRAGPDLMGVTERREAQWLTEFVMDPGRMREMGDPTAAELVARFPGVRMPNLGLSENDAADLIAYLQAQSDRIAEAREVAAREHHEHGEGAQGGGHHHGGSQDDNAMGSGEDDHGDGHHPGDHRPDR